MRVFLIPTTILGVTAWAILGYLIYFVPPKIEGNLILSNLSYVLILTLIALTVTISLVFYFISSFFLPKSRTIDPTYSSRALFRRSLRRGFLIATVTTSLMALNALGILNLINATLIIGIAVLVEIYFSSR
ncbi:MAG: hypothetical protein A2126_02130 [Candidatus Woykebacteria bacterium GWB1_45_5]|uniref:Uncharacterized protein n=2 Tax=Candidatus Woykeibacteriota TaxID=1817899 RepID=A0A1G1W0S5_9BACT|nr:MAG: hypothetical protein A2113_00080 [Candidatus Woykebacteria bacterium GWA1_44_8]OGY24574.1 MAG: hypothetical protein A2126_02130 [Candidatus Woykebacteria bacterium GWB1_45_5]